jgi:hypothetical protein
VEITCPWAWIDCVGEIFEKAYKKKVGKYDQLKREMTEAYPDRPVIQSTIVVGATGFAKITRSEGEQLARFSRELVDAAICGSFDIYTDRTARIKYNRERPPLPAEIQILEEHELDCGVEEDEEVEDVSETCGPENIQPGMSAELLGIDEEIGRASCCAVNHRTTRRT